MKEGEDPEDGEAKEEGVTFNLWKKSEQPPPAEPVFDEVNHTVLSHFIFNKPVCDGVVTTSRFRTNLPLERTPLGFSIQMPFARVRETIRSAFTHMCTISVIQLTSCVAPRSNP